MTNNKGKPGAKKTNALPPLDVGSKSPSSVRRSPQPTSETRRRTRSVDPDPGLPALELSPRAALEHATSVESVAAGRVSMTTTAPSSPKLSPREEGRKRGGSFRLTDGLQHRQPRIRDEEPLAEPKKGKPLNLEPLDGRQRH